MKTNHPPDSLDAVPSVDDKPPVLGSWRALYLLLVGALAVQVLLYALLTRAYSS